jgi:DHA1 family tetracycline resistance protein-like MFS transporter
LKKQTNLFLASIFVTAFLDMLGVGIIIPIMPALFFSKSNTFPQLIGHHQANWAFCLLMASFSFMQFFGAPILGALSDRFGRKKIIVTSLSVAVFAYALFGIAIEYQMLWLLYVSRMMAGFMGGNLSVLFSAISDVSKPEDKPKNFALIGIAFGLGFILGPFIGGVLSSSEVVSWFSLSTPFILASTLSLVNALMVYMTFQETLKIPKHSNVSFFKGFVNVYHAFTSKNINVLFSISFLTTLGFSFFTQFFSVFMYEKFKLIPREVGYIFAFVGLCLVFTQGFVVRRWTNKFLPENIVSKTLLGMGLSIICIVYPSQVWGVVLCNAFLAFFQGVNSPNLLSLVSKQASPSQQGEILGVNQSMQSLAQFIPPMVIGVLGGEKGAHHLPFVFGGGVITLAWLLFILLYKKNNAS